MEQGGESEVRTLNTRDFSLVNPALSCNTSRDICVHDLESETFLIELKKRWVYVTATIKFIRVKSELFQTMVSRPMNFRNIELVQNSAYFLALTVVSKRCLVDLDVTVELKIICSWVIRIV